MKKILIPLFVLLGTVITFNSCSDDDDDENSATVSTTINGQELKDGSTYTLASGTVSTDETGSDTVTLVINSDKGIKTINATLNNDFEEDVTVIDAKGNILNENNEISGNPTKDTIKFIGVYGTYTVKISTTDGSKTIKFTLGAEGSNAVYDDATRALCNTQTIEFDGNGKVANKKIIGVTYTYSSSSNTKQINNVCNITEDTYNTYLAKTSTALGQLGKSSSFVNNYSLDTSVQYFVVKSSSIYYLMKVTSVDSNLLKAEINY